MYSPKNKNLFFGGIILIIGIFLGWVLSYFLNKDFKGQYLSINKIHPVAIDYKFISPLLGFDISGGQEEFDNLKPLRDEVNGLIDGWVSGNNVTSISVYFRNMENGQWIGINENDNYDSASLLKVPFMIAYFKKAEVDSAILFKKIYYNKEKIVEYQESVQVPLLVPNTYYSVEELIKNMIVESDNSSKKLLLENIDLNYVNSIFNELGFPLLGDENYKVSAKKYSLFFRTLYNATFLNREMSERALNLLAQAEFKYGLRGGVPSEIPIAHKFGDHALFQNKKISQVELHDCGVVYYPNHPYFLCVMTKGRDLQKLTEVIKEISGLVYKKTSEGLLSN